MAWGRILVLGWLWSIAAAASAGPVGTATVTARLAADGIRASVRLDRAVTRFAFAGSNVVREEFELLTPGLELKGNSVMAAKPFRRFELLIRPMKQERDAKYPAHFRIGAGGVLFAPALKADPAAWRTKLAVRTAKGQIRAPATGSVAEGFVYIGPAELRSEDERIVVVADPETPAWLVERTRSALAAAVAAFGEALGAPLPRKPLLIVRHQPGERSFNVGDVTPGFVTALRFHGGAWERPDEKAGKAIQAFILHEAFHFWNGGLARHSDGTPTWLHEGGAEYAAMLGGLRGGVFTEEEVGLNLADSLQRCRTALQLSGDKPLAEMGFLSAQVRYPCGMVLQWAADLHLRQSSGGKRMLLDAWGEVIRSAAAKPERSYGIDDFYRAAGIDDPEAVVPIALLVHTGGGDRWRALPEALNALGARVVPQPSPTSRRFTLLFHLLRQSCRSVREGEGFGFYTEATKVKLDSPEGCGVLTGDPWIESIERGDPFEVSAETYAAVQRRCAAGAVVRVRTADGRDIEAPCAAPLGDAPDDYRVERWRPPAPA